jgi:tetratricopeptide (TPR) repeat protein
MELAEDLRKILKIRFTESEVVEIERSGGGKVRLAVLGALLITVLALSIYSFWPSASEDLGIDPTAIAVFPFSIRGDESIQYLGEGMVDLLYASLDGAGEFRSISPARVIGALAERTDPLDPESAAVLARQLRAGLYILGSIVRVGEELRITATLHGENGTTEQTALAVAAGEAELPRSIDSVASDLLRGRIGKADLPPGIDTNLPALRAFLDGQRSMRNGDWDKAVEDYLRAVVADSNFAYGYARMSMAAGYPHDTERQLYACEKALALRDQLSDHMADLVQINQQFLYELSDEPTARLRKLVARYPDDSVAWYMLADYGAHCGPLLGYPRTEAVVAMNRAFEAGIGDDDYGLLFHQRVLTAAVGDMDAYDRTLKQLEELNPDGDLSAWARLEAALLHRDTAARREAMSDLALAPVNSIIGAANTMMGGLVEGVTNLGAAREIGSILQSPERTAPVQCLGSIIDAYADAAEGRISLALKKLREARAVDVDYAIAFESYVALAAFLPEGVGMDPRVLRGELLAWAPEPAPADWTLDSNPVSDPHRGLHGDLRLYLLGLSGARAGDVTAAELYAGSLAENGSIGPTRVLADGIRAELMFGSGLAVEAIPMLEPPNLKFNWIFTHFSPFLARTRERFLLAEALREAGELDQALVWYNLASMQSTLDVLYRAPCHLRRGEIHEELGNDEDALRHYRRFVELWAECDPELRPRVDEARMAIARLES